MARSSSVLVKNGIADLRSLLGDARVRECAPVSVDGISLNHVIAPQTGEELSETLHCLSEHGLAALVCGGGSRLGFGNLPSRADVLLRTEGFSGIQEIDEEEGVIHLGAGTLLSEATESVLSVGWELPIDPPGTATTLGGALATAATGPRFSHPRDVVLGLEVVLATGARTKCGGRVIKNVTGYDLAKLYIGSLGSLGVIEGAWLRLKPIPEETIVLFANLSYGGEGCARALSASRHATVRVGAILTPRMVNLDSRVYGSEKGLHLVLELSGDAPAVARDRESLCKDLAAETGAHEQIEMVRELQGGEGYSDALRVRLRCLPTRIAAVIDLFEETGGACLAYPARGQVIVRFSSVSESEIDVIFCAARRAAEIGLGSFVVETAPVEAKKGRDMFGSNSVNRKLHAALKRAFDPQEVLNPGRFAGFL